MRLSTGAWLLTGFILHILARKLILGEQRKGEGPKKKKGEIPEKRRGKAQKKDFTAGKNPSNASIVR